jgi:hypothetical protein
VMVSFAPLPPGEDVKSAPEPTKMAKEHKESGNGSTTRTTRARNSTHA